MHHRVSAADIPERRAALNDLQQHLQQCAAARGRLHRLRCTVEACDDWLSTRTMSLLGATTIVMLAGLAWVV